MEREGMVERVVRKNRSVGASGEGTGALILFDGHF
jgi:hypothetical protein